MESHQDENEKVRPKGDVTELELEEDLAAFVRAKDAHVEQSRATAIAETRGEVNQLAAEAGAVSEPTDQDVYDYLDECEAGMEIKIVVPPDQRSRQRKYPHYPRPEPEIVPQNPEEQEALAYLEEVEAENPISNPKRHWES